MQVIDRLNQNKLKRCPKKECCKQYRHVKFKGTMTKWPVQKHTHTHAHTHTHTSIQTVASIYPLYSHKSSIFQKNCVWFFSCFVCHCLNIQQHSFCKSFFQSQKENSFVVIKWLVENKICAM